MDMSQVIVPKSDQINADDLIGRDMTITIRDVQIRGGQEQPVSILFEGSDKAFRPCKSMSRVLVYCWGPDAKQYIGRSLTLYRDPNVKWGGMAVGGIRISHASHIDKAQTMVLAESKANRKPFTVKPLQVPVGGQKADRAADGVRDLLARIAAGEDIAADAAVTTQREWLAQKRPELAKQIDDALATRKEDPFGTTGNEDHGEAHTTTDQLIEARRLLATKVTHEDVLSLKKVWMDELDAEDQARFHSDCEARIAEIKGQG